MALLAAFALLLASALTGALVLRSDRRLAAQALLLARHEVRADEWRRVVAAQAAFEDVQGLTEAAVEGGTRTVRFIHFGIAAIPFGILEVIPPTRAPARVVRLTHDFIAGAVYGGISLVNRGIGRLARRAAATQGSTGGVSVRSPHP